MSADDANSRWIVGGAAASITRPAWARRLLEILPPVAVWLVITAPIWGAIVAPLWLGYFLILFSVYWLLRSFWFAGGILLGYRRLTRAQARDWAAEAQSRPGFDRTHHLVFVPTYGEGEEILADMLHYVTEQDFPLDRVSVVVAFEERDREAPARAQKISARFASLFANFLVTFHPDLPGEVKGKSSNLAWASRRVEEELVATGRIDPRHTLVTVCDADSRLHRKFLSALTTLVLGHPEGRFHIFQPILLFYGNHWRLAAPIRALNSVYSLWAMARLIQGHRLVTQSTYSLSWQVARQVHFWDVDIIPEDSHMFFKVQFQVGRRVKVRPIYLPVYSDAAEGATFWDTVVNSYLQIRRWAWGVSDVPYVVLGSLRARDLPWPTRFFRVLGYVEEHFMWPAHWFLLSLGGVFLPLLNPTFASSPLGVWQTGLVSTILGFTLPCLLIAIFVDARLRPRHPDGEDPMETLFGIGSFFLLPIVSFVLSTLPALDAHTRLLFGRYLEYRVTEKLPTQARARAAAVGPRLGLRGVRFEQALQHRAYASGSTTAVTDAVLTVYRDLR